MGEDKKDNEWYCWTGHFMLGEDGFIYHRQENITEQLTYGRRKVEWSEATKLETASHYVVFDQLPETRINGQYGAPFGQTQRVASICDEYDTRAR